ncbi:MAG: hypothetical protein M3137_19705 [Actinomycetota bacterium]|nr:hypothetical protein [Actinomycetota bacterium]
MAIAQRVRRWQLHFSTQVDRTRYDAVRAAANCLVEHADLLPEGTSATNTTQIAVLAIEIHQAFLHDDKEPAAVVDPGPDAVRAEMRRRAR